MGVQVSSDSQQRVVCGCVVVGVGHGISSKTRWENSNACLFSDLPDGLEGCPGEARGGGGSLWARTEEHSSM